VAQHRDSAYGWQRTAESMDLVVRVRAGPMLIATAEAWYEWEQP